MRWPWRRALDEPDDLPVPDKAGARDALDHAREERASVEARWPAVNRLVGALDAHRRENHFGDLFTQAMRRRP